MILRDVIMPAFDPEYPRPLLHALCIQLGLLVLTALILDHGIVFTACRYASVGFWAGVVLILVRRPVAPTKSDLLYFRFGLPVISVTVVPLFLCVWQIKGAI
ncbi:MAG: hypothetical protein HZA46_16115 [Planctomycetales bacterium]|nr:hypothetical protein [Planctomycetales bacterium]